MTFLICPTPGQLYEYPFRLFSIDFPIYDTFRQRSYLRSNNSSVSMPSMLTDILPIRQNHSSARVTSCLNELSSNFRSPSFQYTLLKNRSLMG